MTVPASEEMNRNPIKGGFTTEHASALLVIAAVAFLILVSRGWRGGSVAGVGVSIK
jgi:hypothetical protein